MKKMMLLASVVALAALMLAAAPALAQDDEDGPGNVCDHPGQGTPPFCDEDDNDGDDDDDNDFDFVFCDFDGDGDDDGDDCEFNNNDRDIFRNIGNVDVSPTIDISQDIDQDCDSGEVSQPIDVTGGGDNSIQTVGLQPTANTGCAQNATGILQAAPIVAGFGGDTIFNTDDNGDNDGRFIRCDRDGDGNDDGDDCDDFDNDRVFCDRDGDGHDDGDDDCFVFVNDDNDNGDNGDVFRSIGNDNVDITGPDFGDVDVDSDASIDVSPSLDVDGGGTINQTAIAVGDDGHKWWA
jgi:hypothetical protein